MCDGRCLIAAPSFYHGSEVMIFAYARVSTGSQTLDAQIDELTKAGAGKIFAEKVTGSKTDRAELQKLMKRLRAGDTLIVTRLDRLARSTRDLLNIVDELSKNGVKF